MSPFGDIHNRRGTTTRRDPQRQEMTLFDQMFSPMRMSLFHHDLFGNHLLSHHHHHHHHHHPATLSSFNISFNGNGNSRPVAKKTTKSTKIINGRRVVTTRVEENGQTTETVEEDGRLTSRRINGIAQAIK